ncbi:15712_t:CDS:2 [Acaulospora colombiana]|uniref:15712_t:CDS:1 n=1 Tax=Acaulospora colombiana TaxID=27376 RepID=A0ACA9KVU7_9GLOM|nr:15712_t:CDS:2 [Acaulospora colombiana]
MKGNIEERRSLRTRKETDGEGIVCWPPERVHKSDTGDMCSKNRHSNQVPVLPREGQNVVMVNIEIYAFVNPDSGNQSACAFGNFHDDKYHEHRGNEIELLLGRSFLGLRLNDAQCMPSSITIQNGNSS